MKLVRRTLLLCFAACSATAWAQAPQYPAKPVKFLVPFAPGGGSDSFARMIAQKLNETKGYTIIVENKPGAGGNLGAEAALREPADGYTLLVVSGSYAGNAVLSKPAFDPIAAIEPIVQFTREPIVLIVGSNSKYKTLRDLILDAKANPGRLSYGTSGVGGLAHLVTEYFSNEVGVTMTHIPYKGTSAALTDLASGQIQLMMAGSSSVTGLVKGNRARALAVASPSRLGSLPEAQTFVEQGVTSFRADLWHGLVARKGTPKPVITKLNADINAVLSTPDMKAKFAEVDVAAAGGTSGQFLDVIRTDMQRWKKIVQQANITLN